YFTRLWNERAAAPPKFDFLSLMAHNPDTRGMVDEPLEFLGNLMLLIGGVIFMHDNPAEFAKLKANPALAASAVPEIIRYQSPVAHMRRTALEDFEFQGRQF